MTATAPAITMSMSIYDAQWHRRHILAELAETMESLSISLRESAWRGDDQQSLVLTRQHRTVLIEALALTKELTGSDQ